MHHKRKANNVDERLASSLSQVKVFEHRSQYALKFGMLYTVRIYAQGVGIPI